MHNGLYNHIYHNINKDELNEVFFENKNYLKIINHKNYFPRLVEFITNPQNFDQEYHKTFYDFIFSNLENPEEIWKAAFEKQLTDEDKFLLLSLFSFAQSRVSKDKLNCAFEARYKYEIKENGFKRQTNAFQTSLKTLTKSFINSIKTEETNYFGLSNPSIADFLINYLRKNSEEKERLLYSIISPYQLNGHFSKDRKDKIILTSHFLNEYYKTFKNIIPSFNDISSPYIILDTLHLFTTFFKAQVEKETQTFNLYLKKLIITKTECSVNPNNLIDVLTFIPQNLPLETKEMVIRNWDKFILILIHNAEAPEDLASIKPLHELYGINLENTLLKTKDIKGVFEEKISELFNEYIDNSPPNYSEHEILEAYDYGVPNLLEDLYWEHYYNVFFPIFDLDEYFDDFHHDYDIDFTEILNQMFPTNWHHEDDSSFDLYKEKSSTKSENELIEELFDR